MSGATYLDGNFAPVATELTATDLEVTGAVPPDLAGRYIRTGPNPFAAQADTYHWFAGDGMVHGVDLHGGRARWYRNRWVRSPEASAHLDEVPVPRADGGWYPGSGNTNVFAHAGRILAVTEGSLPYELTCDLDTVATRNFGGPLPAGINAHPKVDPSTGEMHVMTYGFDDPALRYHVIGTSGELVSTVDIDLPAPVMLHDMGLTASRVVLFDLPVLFDLELALQGVALPFRWRPDNGARVGLLPRTGTAAGVVWIDVEPCFVYHPLNAFDAGDRVVIDLVVHDHAFADDDEPVSDSPRLQRWTIDPTARTVLTETVDDRGTEFPRGDERLTGRRHRYGYTIGASSVRHLGGLGEDPRTTVRKHDLVGGTTVEVDLGPGRLASEMVFVPAGRTAGEDDGWLMGYVYDAARGASDLVILDAHDLGDPVATIHLPARVPQGFHGNWIPDSALA